LFARILLIWAMHGFDIGTCAGHMRPWMALRILWCLNEYKFGRAVYPRTVLRTLKISIWSGASLLELRTRGFQKKTVVWEKQCAKQSQDIWVLERREENSWISEGTMRRQKAPSFITFCYSEIIPYSILSWLFVFRYRSILHYQIFKDLIFSISCITSIKHV
jgi:hypothetical protein